MKKIVVGFKELNTCIGQYSDSKNTYLILDAAQISEETSIFLKKCQNNIHIELYSLFAGTAEGNAPFEVAPILIYFKDIQLLSDDVLLFLQKTWAHEQSLNLVFSSLALIEFIRKMKKYLTVEFPDGSQKIMRWFDPRVIKNINNILDGDQILEFYSDIACWIISTRNYLNIESNQLIIMGGE